MVLLCKLLHQLKGGECVAMCVGKKDTTTSARHWDLDQLLYDNHKTVLPWFLTIHTPNKTGIISEQQSQGREQGFIPRFCSLHVCTCGHSTVC